MPTRTASSNTILPDVIDVTWTGLLNGDDGSWFDSRNFADRTFQVFGTPGVGGSITLQGSNDQSDPPTNAFTLTNHVGATLVFAAAGGGTSAEAPRWVRPLVTSGDGTTSLTVRLVARR